MNVHKLTAMASVGILAFQCAPLAVSAAEKPVSVRYVDDSKNIISGAEYTIMIKLSNKYIAADNNGNVQQWDKNGSSTKWCIESVGNGACRIVSADDHSKAMTVENGNNKNGNNIFLSDYQDSPSQHFIIHKANEAYYITAECSGNAALDVFDQSKENGANIDQWDYWGGDGQTLYIQPADNKYRLIRGDIDGDGELSFHDRILMAKGISYGFDDAAKVVADMNGDGKADQADFKVMTDFLLGNRVNAETYCTIPYTNNNVPQQNTEPEQKPNQAQEDYVAYLFAYFSGNAPNQEKLFYAVSVDGYNFKTLNGGKAVWSSNVGTKCIRDPYIFKGEDGFYYLLATDMKATAGWDSNRNILTAKSSDLVNWKEVTIIPIANASPNMKRADRAWAPQAIYDPEKKSYMIYFAARVPGIDNRTIMYYAYSKDLKKLDTDPKILIAPKNGNDAIDSDIIFENGKYYMYYKNETNKRIYLAKADHANGPYTEIKQVSEGSRGVEGPNIYKKIGTNKWLMMSDAYRDRFYVMQETTDLENFKTVDRKAYSFDFTPRHGYVIPITAEQYNALTKNYPSAGLPKLPNNK